MRRVETCMLDKVNRCGAVGHTTVQWDNARNICSSDCIFVYIMKSREDVIPSTLIDGRYRSTRTHSIRNSCLILKDVMKREPVSTGRFYTTKQSKPGAFKQTDIA
ncbi:hypothetical protein EVAR_62657_1 [Eumeta japonica]|uniref:Uncharacterized protein n=1 Tax=Eumeta variegata TaxID=151549 RepID=A0A4C1YZ46_EUMVA|nr:hypothetical protein EVAR_62657_1 [Eumeta japonica]